MGNPSKIEQMAGQAMAYAVAPYTFGIIQNDHLGREAREIGTGFGVRWKGRPLILTAAHTVWQTPDEMLYYLLPIIKGVEILDSTATTVVGSEFYQERVQLEKPVILLSDADSHDDLAAILLPTQPRQVIEAHFYEFDEKHVTPDVGCSVIFLGYPATRSEHYGANYVANPHYDCGEICVGTRDKDYDPSLHFLIRYSSSKAVDPHGLSGSGVWFSPPIGMIWSPNVHLAGLLTHYFEDKKALRCYRVETVLSFLESLQLH
jgi:hypothetical protein